MAASKSTGYLEKSNLFIFNEDGRRVMRNQLK